MTFQFKTRNNEIARKVFKRQAAEAADMRLKNAIQQQLK